MIACFCRTWRFGWFLAGAACLLVSALSAQGQISGRYTISGQITVAGNALPGVTVALSGDQNSSTITDSSGNYSFPGVLAGGNYTVTPFLADYGFTPPSATFMNLSSDETANFSAVANALRFIPVVPCRVADTRNPDGPFGGPAIEGQSSRSFELPNGNCSIPSTAAAYALNVAVVPQGPLGYLTVWPTGQSQPLVSTLNSDSRTKSNAAIIPAGMNGAISVFASNTTDVVLDIDGYFVASSNASALPFYPITPCRVADTRNAVGPLGGPYLSGQQARSFPILSSSCNIPSAAQAYSFNLAAVPRGPLGYLTAWPTGAAQPFVANLNAPTAAVTSNAAIVAAGTGGSIDVFVTNDTDLVIDVNGYFGPVESGGLSLYSVQPCRALDTRNSTQAFSGTLDVNVPASNCGVPSAAAAYVFNATVVPEGPLGYLTLWADGMPQPYTATLNASDGAITSNMALVSTLNGSIDAFASNSTQLVLDLFGYFAP